MTSTNCKCGTSESNPIEKALVNNQKESSEDQIQIEATIPETPVDEPKSPSLKDDSAPQTTSDHSETSSDNPGVQAHEDVESPADPSQNTDQLPTEPNNLVDSDDGKPDESNQQPIEHKTNDLVTESPTSVAEGLNTPPSSKPPSPRPNAPQNDKKGYRDRVREDLAREIEARSKLVDKFRNTNSDAVQIAQD